MDDLGTTTLWPAAAIVTEERLSGRRVLLLMLNLASWIGLGLAMARIVGVAGWSWQGATVMALFLLGLPWTLLAFWNAVIGFVILRCVTDPASYTNAALRATPPDAAIWARSAICIAIRHENVARVAARIGAMRDSLDATGQAGHFEFHVLSDSTRPEFCAEEMEVFGADPALHYRRREATTGSTAGN